MQNMATGLSCLKTDILNVFITNLGKYNEGELIGEWISLPSTYEEINACFKRIGIDGLKYEEYFLTDYESSINDLIKYINEYSNLDELNYLATKIESLTSDELMHYEAIVEMGDNVSSVKDLINLTDNLECYAYLPDIDNSYDLGYYWIEESGCYDLTSLGNITNYLDYDKLGNDILLEQGGYFASQGYLYFTNESFSIEYDGKSIPDEYRILSQLKC